MKLFVACLAPFALLFPVAAAAQTEPAPQSGPANDTLELPGPMVPMLEKYTTCLTEAVVAVQPTASSDFAALARQALTGCREVRAKAVADSRRALASDAKPSDIAALVDEVFAHIDTTFPDLTLRLRDQIISESAAPAK